MDFHIEFKVYHAVLRINIHSADLRPLVDSVEVLVFGRNRFHDIAGLIDNPQLNTVRHMKSFLFGKINVCLEISHKTQGVAAIFIHQIIFTQKTQTLVDILCELHTAVIRAIPVRSISIVCLYHVDRIFSIDDQLNICIFQIPIVADLNFKTRICDIFIRFSFVLCTTVCASCSNLACGTF